MTGRRPPPTRQLSHRDLSIVEVVARYRVLTGDQLRRWMFPVADNGSSAGALRRSQRCLKRLVNDAVLDTLERRVGGVRAGSAGHCYVLGYRGQRVAFPDRRARTPSAIGDRFVAHALAVGELVVGAVEAERSGGIELLGVEPEPEVWRHYVGRTGTAAVLKPDLFLAIGIAETEHRWFVEVDRATESMVRIDVKCRQYLDYLRTGREQDRHGVFPKVLWTVPHDRRRRQLNALMTRLPPPADRLFAVTLHDNAIIHLKGGAP